MAREQVGAARWQAAPLDSLRQYVRENCSRFVDLRRGGIEDISTHDHRACPGYIHQREDGGLEYLFSDRRFEQVVGGAAAAKRLKTDLAGRGLLAIAAGAGSDRYSVRRTIGKGTDGKARREQVVAVRATAFVFSRRRSGIPAGAAAAVAAQPHLCRPQLARVCSNGGAAFRPPPRPVLSAR